MRVYPGRRQKTAFDIYGGVLGVVAFLLAVILLAISYAETQSAAEIKAAVRTQKRASREIVVNSVPVPELPPVAIDAEAYKATAPADGIMEAEAVPVEVLTVSAAKQAVAKGEYLGRFRTTGYCNCPRCSGKWAYGPTASGAMPVEGITIAVDPGVIKLGTKVVINNHEYTAQDTGKHIYGKRIDFYYEDHDIAHSHGVQYMDVYLAR